MTKFEAAIFLFSALGGSFVFALIFALVPIPYKARLALILGVPLILIITLVVINPDGRCTVECYDRAFYAVVSFLAILIWFLVFGIIASLRYLYRRFPKP